LLQWWKLFNQSLQNEFPTDFCRVTSFLLSRCFVCFILRFAHTRRFLKLKQLLTTNRVTIQSYTWSFWSANHVTYLRCSFSHHPFYIGATSVSVFERESSRTRKFKQLCKGTLGSFELALRWWKSSNSYWHFITIPLQQHDCTTSTFAHEHYLIHKFCPALNQPFITSIISHTDRLLHHSTARIPNHRIGTFGFRLWKRARRLSKRSTPLVSSPVAGHDDPARGFRILQMLAAHTSESFKACRLIRSSSVTPIHLYALLRQTNVIEEPYQTKVRALILSALKFRKLSIPQFNRPLVLPWLAHPAFPKQMRDWLQKQIHKNRQQFPPLHIPNPTVVQARHRTIGDSLFNWRKSLIQWSISPPTCTCQQHTLPDNLRFRGHIMCSGVDMAAADHRFRILSQPCNTAYYPSKTTYTQLALLQVSKWFKHQGLGNPPPEFQDLIQSAWQQHVQYSKQTTSPPFRRKDIKYIQQQLPDLVLHVADHQANTFHVYCPKAFYDLILATFTDSNVFTVHKSLPAQAIRNIRAMLTNTIVEKYSWGVKINAKLPSAYILAKTKKQYTTARPIVAFTGTIFAKLFTALGLVLQTIYTQTFRGFPGIQTMNQMLHQLHRCLHKMTLDRSDDKQFILVNQDLVGFFTSIPTDRIVFSVQVMLQRYIGISGRPDQDLSVPLNHKTDKYLRVFRGKRRHAGRSFQIIKLSDIVPLVQFSIKFSFFTCTNLVLSQNRGSCIGSPCSPALCSIVALCQEMFWSQASQIMWHSVHKLGIPLLQRYVDNRLVIVTSAATHLTWIKQFLHLDFYQPPICLETVDDTNYLGFNINIEEPSCTYIQPSISCPVRPYYSACSDQQKLTGFITRMHLLCRGTWPRSHIVDSSNELIRIFVSQGYPEPVLRQLTSKIFRRYQIK
jgi:hypothetical protein